MSKRLHAFLEREPAESIASAATASVGTWVRMSYVTLYVANCKISRVRWL